MSIGVSESRRPSLELLRRLTAQHVFDQLLARQPLTRAEIAAHTGISKPTISEGVRRLLESGVVAESGRQSGKRGPAGTYLTIRADLAAALTVSIGPDGVRVESFDLQGARLHREQQPVGVPVAAGRLAPVVVDAVRAAVAATPGPIRGCVVSVAGPVDQRTGKLVPLPHAPFILGEFAPRVLLAELVPAAVEVDNDVNWAALGELHEGSAQALANFVLCYLGAGLGGGVIVGGQVVHGRTGFAGELAHLRTVGPDGADMPLLECFARLDLLRPGTDVIDVDRVVDAVTGSTSRRRRDVIARAVAGAIGSITALLDPEAVLVGGPWGGTPGFAEQVAEQFSQLSALHTEIRRGGLAETAPLTGLRIRAVKAARSAVAETL